MTLNHLLPTLSWLTSIASRFTRTTAEAEDCAIIALERIAPRLDEFPTEPQARAFLAKTARNAAIDASRGASLRTAKEKASDRWWEDSDSAEVALRMRLVMEYGVPTLPLAAQKVAALLLAGKTSEEAAAELGVSLKAVRNQRALIIKDLKRWVKRGKLQ
jgi:RNA polymerase sigma factor (sigma-70 family)